jgi:hypothetical protein
LNVTIKISDEVCRDARHRAVDAGRSLSGWIEDLLRKELSRSTAQKPRTLLEALGNDALSNVEIDFPRDQSAAREVDLT